MKYYSMVFFRPMILGLFVASALVIPWVASAALVSGAGGMILSPNHAASGNSHNGHYFAKSEDAHHFAWNNATPATPGITTINYDFRSQGGAANIINAPANVGQRAAVLAAFDAWSAATNGKIQFVRNTSASRNAIINVGTGNLAALGYRGGPGGVLGLGGGNFPHKNKNGVHGIKRAIVWQDRAENWDTIMGNGNPRGTFDYFTVAAQEIGHALGLGHVSGSNIMNGSYTGEQTVLSQVDIAHIQSIYGVLTAVPLPPAVWLLGSGLLLLLVIGRRQQLRPREILAL